MRTDPHARACRSVEAALPAPPDVATALPEQVQSQRLEALRKQIRFVSPPTGKPNWEGVSREERERYLAAYGRDDASGSYEGAMSFTNENVDYFDSTSTCCSRTTGSVKVNVEPWPTCDSTQILPPCISMMRLDMASPKPVPPFLRVMALSAC